MIFLGDVIQAAVIHTKSEAAILLFDEEDQSAVG